MHGLWIVTLVFGVVAALIAHGKGRNSLGWFSAGMLVGPFALIVAVLEPIEKDGMYIRCPACREVIHEGAATCRYCHVTLGHVS